MCTEFGEIDFIVFHSLSKLCNKWATQNWTKGRNGSLPLISVSLIVGTATLDLFGSASRCCFQYLNMAVKNDLTLFSKEFALFLVGLLNTLTVRVGTCLLSSYICATVIFSGFPAETQLEISVLKFLYKLVSIQTYKGLIPVPCTFVVSNAAHLKCWHSQEAVEKFSYRLNSIRKDRNVGCVKKGIISIQQTSHLPLKSSIYWAQGVQRKVYRR